MWPVNGLFILDTVKRIDAFTISLSYFLKANCRASSRTKTLRTDILYKSWFFSYLIKIDSRKTITKIQYRINLKKILIIRVLKLSYTRYNKKMKETYRPVIGLLYSPWILIILILRFWGIFFILFVKTLITN